MLSKSLLRNTLLLTGVSLLMSLVGMGFQARLARALGSTALGLYQLTLSVSNLCATLAVSGIRFASTRLIAEELTAAQVREDAAAIKNTAGKLLRINLRYSLAVSAVLFFCAEALGGLIYHSRESARFLRLLAPLVPVKYTDMAVDGCLKGLGLQVWSMGVNIAEAAIGLLLMKWLLPRLGLAAYLGVLCFSECFNLCLSVFRLRLYLRSSPGGARRPYGGSAKCAYTAGK